MYNQSIRPKGEFAVTTDIIPEPQSLKIKGDAVVFSLTRLAEIFGDEKSKNVISYFRDFCSSHFEIEFVGTGKEQISFSVCANLPDEGYRLAVSENSVKIEGGSEKGVFWGVQSLLWLLIQNDRSICALEIEDFPQTENRGVMLDCASWFFTPEAIKLVLDSMAFHKLDVFHWKLSGDMGWRIELFDNFLLSQIGSERAFTGLGKEPHGGYYSQTDVKDILKYAQERYITVIPELDFPDHTAAAVCAYPSLSCRGTEISVPTRFGDTSACLCLGKDETFDFVFSVLDETIELFGCKYVHIGGEKSQKSPRSSCPHCLKKMAELKTDERGLTRDFFERTAAYLEKKEVKAIIRSDEKDLPLQNAVLDVRTESENPDIQKLDSFFLLSLPYGELGVQKCYEHEPFSAQIMSEAVLNTEHASSMKKVGELLFPRLGAFCENAWTKKENRSFEQFLEKTDSYYAFLNLLGLFASKRKDAFPGRLKSTFEKLKMKFGR